jgi:sialate O-acetylesterase
VKEALNGEQEAARADFPQIRLFTVARKVADQPAQDVEGKWAVCSPETAAGFSAVGYFFGRELNRTLGVPIGLIHSSWGATAAEAWTSMPALGSDEAFAPALNHWRETVARYPQAMKDYEQRLAEWKEQSARAKAEAKAAPPEPRRPTGPGDRNQPAGLYNAMVAPVLPFAIRGAIWYQGESNGGSGYLYRKLFPTLIKDWRAAWAEGDFPFLFIQLASFRDAQVRPSEAGSWPEVREAQTMTLALPKTAMAVTVDIGDAVDIHPKNKQEAGRRLALGALSVAYGRELLYSGPMYSSMSVEGDSIRLRFRDIGGGLVTKDGQPLKGFAVAGKDRRFAWAEARIDGDTVVVRSDKVPQPAAARYGWADNPVCNLCNKEGLPASPFRTDDWPEMSYPWTPELLKDLNPEPAAVSIAYRADKVTLDGDLSEWTGVRPMPMPYDWLVAGSIRLAWREDGLYGAVSAKDASVKPEGDGVEFYVEKDFARAVSRGANTAQYMFAPDPASGPGKGRATVAYGDEKANAGLSCAWRPTADGYALEFFIPADALKPAQPKPDTKLGLNMALMDDGRAAELFFCDRASWRCQVIPIMWGTVQLTR